MSFSTGVAVSQLKIFCSLIKTSKDYLLQMYTQLILILVETGTALGAKDQKTILTHTTEYCTNENHNPFPERIPSIHLEPRQQDLHRRQRTAPPKVCSHRAGVLQN